MKCSHEVIDLQLVKEFIDKVIEKDKDYGYRRAKKVMQKPYTNVKD